MSKSAAAKVIAMVAVLVLGMAGLAVADTGGQVSLVASGPGGAKALARNSVSGVTTISLDGAGTAGVRSVEYHLDDATGTGQVASTATQAPFALKIDTARLKPGAHTLLAIVTSKAGSVIELFARFEVAGSTTSGPTGQQPQAQATTVNTAEKRNIYDWPFAWDSIWNLPLSKQAQYAPLNMKTDMAYIDWEDISVYEKFPVKTLDAAGKDVQVHVDPNLEAGGEFNNCATFLMTTPDKKTVIQGQPLKLEKGGTPSYKYPWDPIKLDGDGIMGCHGGSNLSGIGGSIRAGEMLSDKPLRHALKIGISCDLWCSTANNGWRWPASKADKGWRTEYKGENPRVNMGTMFALPPDTDLSQFKSPDVRKVAQALRDYGAYVMDSTGGGGSTSITVQHGYEDEFPNAKSKEMQDLYEKMVIVTNSTKATPGGGPLGSPRRAPCAPAFTDGTGGAPASC